MIHQPRVVRQRSTTAVTAAVLAALLTGCGPSSGSTAAGDASGTARGGPTAASPAPTSPASSSPGSSSPGSSSPGSSGPAASGPAPSTSAPSATPGATGVPGDVEVTVPVGTPTVLPTVALGATASTAGARLAVTRTEAVTGEARGPGQTAGPAVRLTVTVTAGSSAVPVDAVTVDLRDAAGVSATRLDGPGAAPFEGVVAARATTTGVYVFSLPTNRRADVSVTVRIGADAPVAVFAGSLPG